MKTGGWLKLTLRDKEPFREQTVRFDKKTNRESFTIPT
jgi:hypothetical protein